MIRHILKDGSEVKDVSGYVIRMDEFRTLYRLIDVLNEKGNKYETVSASD